MLGPTWPNRLYLMSGMVDPSGANGGPVYSNYVSAEGFSWKTYPEMLTDAGVSWKLYQENGNYGTNVLEYFDQYQAAPVSPLYQNAMHFYQAGCDFPSVLVAFPSEIALFVPAKLMGSGRVAAKLMGSGAGH